MYAVLQHSNMYILHPSHTTAYKNINKTVGIHLDENVHIGGESSTMQLFTPDGAHLYGGGGRQLEAVFSRMPFRYR